MKEMYICNIMDRKQIDISIINYLKPFGPERIGIFGSLAREESTNNSDIDILVRFKDTLNLLQIAKIHRELSQILGKEADIVTESALKNERLKRHIYDDLQIIFE
jgi:predicted nucleotidyltransferase